MNSQKIITVLALLLIGGVAGFVLGQKKPQSAAMDSNAMKPETQVATSSTPTASNEMEMEPYQIPDSLPAPTVALTATPDPMGGFNLHIATTHFTFAPEKSGKGNVPGEGHGHVLVDGTKVGRAYGNWFYIAALPAGTHTITVELETNDHHDYQVKGMPLKATVDVVAK